MKKAAYIILIVGIAICALPLVSLIWGIAVANIFDCSLSENSIAVCMIGGTDWGPTLTFATMLGWLGIATIPVGGVLIALLAVLLLVDFLILRRRKR